MTVGLEVHQARSGRKEVSRVPTEDLDFTSPLAGHACLHASSSPAFSYPITVQLALLPPHSPITVTVSSTSPSYMITNSFPPTPTPSLPDHKTKKTTARPG